MNLLKQRPIATIGTLATALFAVLSQLVAYGVIPADFSRKWGPWIVLGLLAAIFALAWFHVSPAVKLLQQAQDHQAEIQKFADQLDNGRLPEADLARLRGEFEDAMVSLVNHLQVAPNPVEPAHLQTTGGAHPDAQAVGAPTAPTAQAGAPHNGETAASPFTAS